jgi:hypothetical protein
MALCTFASAFAALGVGVFSSIFAAQMTMQRRCLCHRLTRSPGSLTREEASGPSHHTTAKGHPDNHGKDWSEVPTAMVSDMLLVVCCQL